jgi:hypothetical protein
MHIIEDYILARPRWTSDMVALQNKHIKTCMCCCCRYDLLVRCLTTLQTSVTKSNILISVALSQSFIPTITAEVGKMVNCVQEKRPQWDLGIYLHHNNDAVNKTGNDRQCTYIHTS